MQGPGGGWVNGPAFGMLPLGPSEVGCGGSSSYRAAQSRVHLAGGSLLHRVVSWMRMVTTFVTRTAKPTTCPTAWIGNQSPGLVAAVAREYAAISLDAAWPVEAAAWLCRPECQRAGHATFDYRPAALRIQLAAAVAPVASPAHCVAR